jgi:hypothetical protein
MLLFPPRLYIFELNFYQPISQPLGDFFAKLLLLEALSLLEVEVVCWRMVLGNLQKNHKNCEKTSGKMLFIYFLTIVGRLDFRFFQSIGGRYSNEMSPNGPQAAAMLLSLGSSTSIDNVAESHIKGWKVS